MGEAALPVKHKGLLTLAVMGASIIQILDSTIANVAIPHMQTSLGATQDTVTWVLTSYIIATAVAIPITGWLSDRIGSRRLFLLAVAGFIVTSMLCGAAANLTQMVIFRVFQGICAAFIGPLSQTIMLDINSPERAPKAMAMWGMGIMVAPILGPVIGGWLTESYNWRWVFYINLPIGIPTLLLLWWLLPSRALVRRSKGTSSNVVTFGALSLDLGARLASVRGVGMELTSSEYSLLELLVLQPNTTWSRTRLVEHLYNEASDRDSNVIDVFVARLRKKFDAAGLHGAECITTQRGAGYRFDPAAVPA